MRELILPGDDYRMNWVEGRTQWGSVACKVPLAVEKSVQRDGEVLRERYVFTNKTDRDVFVRAGDIGIYTPFNDDYTSAGVCMTNRCHAHIWCGEEVSYVLALRMGGRGPHLGMVLNEGALRGYGVEREPEKMSNDRGDFILYPSPFSLAPGERYTLAWTLFAHGGKEDFFRKAAVCCEKFLDVRAEKYVLFCGEQGRAWVTPAFAFADDAVHVSVNGEEAETTVNCGVISFQTAASAPGELCCDIRVGAVHTRLRLLVLPGLLELAAGRCAFLAKRQQYHREGSRLDGAYLIYDNEDEACFYAPEYDYNGGRERVGMGLLMAAYLQRRRDGEMERSLLQYAAYVKRELVDEQTGEVYNDYMCDNSYKRLYNAPWFALFYLELYQLYGTRAYLDAAHRIMMRYYEEGGEAFYPIMLPALDLDACLRAAHMDEKAGEFEERFIRHADFLVRTGTDYPASEVNYEQSIVAPAADLLLQAYELTEERAYLDAAKKQLAVLELFSGVQPDYHLNEVAIRHWDGYWFGKRRMYGDTFPHYWSSLSGIVYRRFGRICGDEAYMEKAEKSLRASLSLIGADGTASCAYVYPMSVNGRAGGFYDPYANDQDWGLYLALKELSE